MYEIKTLSLKPLIFGKTIDVKHVLAFYKENKWRDKAP